LNLPVADYQLKLGRGIGRVAGNAGNPGRSVISKVSEILLAMSEGSGQTATELAARTELPLSTVHRLVTELAGWCVLDRNEDGRYAPGAPLRMIAGGCWTATSRSTAAVGLDRVAAPIMDDLFRATGRPVRVGYLDGVTVAYVEKVSRRSPVSRALPAARLPAHATALGKALLAFSPNTVAEILARGLTRYTPRTLTQPDQLQLCLRTIRMTRIALSDGELHETTRAVAAPAFGVGGEVVAAIELQVDNLDADARAITAPLVVAAGSLSRELMHIRQRAVDWMDEQPRTTLSATAANVADLRQA
jgi:IclR family acetate operon transcriptional repressor